jgi:hypothetical protein
MSGPKNVGKEITVLLLSPRFYLRCRVDTIAFSLEEQSTIHSSHGKHMLNKYGSEGRTQMSDSDGYQHVLAANSCFD